MKNKNYKWLGVYTKGESAYDDSIEVVSFDQSWQECLENAYKRKNTYYIDHLVCYGGDDKKELQEVLENRLKKARRV